MANQVLAAQMIPLTVLSLADKCLGEETREAIGRKLLNLQDEWNPGAMPLRRASAPHDLISSEGILGDNWQEVNLNVDLNDLPSAVDRCALICSWSIL